MQEILDKLEKEIKLRFPSFTGDHDIYHLKRVLNLALKIQEKEGGDRLVIAIAAFLHDIHRMMRKEGEKYLSPKDSLPMVKEILEKVNTPEDKISKILHCIEFHEEYSFSKKGKTAEDIETQIVQDADNLDVIGAIGIARVFTWGGIHKVPIWQPEVPFAQETYDEEDENDPSQVHHLQAKVLKLKDSLNTKTAKKMTVKRHKFLKKYLKQFFREWQGKI